MTTLTRDSVVVITGAGSGIGRATALLAAQAGARIAACDVHRDRLDSLATELGDRLLLARTVDVASREEMAAFADAVHALVPAADVVVNNAGVAVGGAFLDTSLDDWDWILGVNLRGVVHGCHFFLPKMALQRRGSIINVASILGLFALPTLSAYCATKFAVLGLTRSLREEVSRYNIGVTAICPGMVDTSIVVDGRSNGKVAAHKATAVKTFQKGKPPVVVAEAILDAVRTNPGVRTVGKDAWALHAAARLVPSAAYRVGALLGKRVS